MWLKGGRVYDQRKRAFRPGDIRIEGNVIAEIGKAPRGAKGAVDLDGAYLLPGFFDCHVHITLDTTAPDPNNPWGDALPGTIALHAARMAGRLLDCGITTAREVGGWDYHEIAVREAINAGHIPGPRLYCAGRLLSVTTGTIGYYRGMYEEANGVDAVRAAARKQLSMGADFIKVMATGAITSTKYEKAEAIQYRLEEIQAAVDIATDNLTHVAAHAHALAGIRNAVEAGCRSIEHGSFGDEAAYRLMAERGTWLVPTLCTTPAMKRDPSFVAGVPPHILDRYERVHATRVHNVKLAHRCGVRIAMGTDVGTPGNHCGDNMQELEVMVNEAGLAPAEAIDAATLSAARMMGLDARLGSLEAGKLADVIAVERDPLADIAVLRKVSFVMKDGRIHRHARA
jgi:imidazolonepropionase-like amidohydrolase